MELFMNSRAGELSLKNGLATFTFSGSGHNTFPTWKMNQIASIFEGLDLQEVKALLITAGEGRSFGVGGDFHEVNSFKGSDEVDEWIAACVRMYTSVLILPIPVVAAIDGYSIGIALQLALCADYRVASKKADLRMPELKLGIACVLGSCLLKERIPPHIVNRMIISCEPWSAEKAYQDGLIDEVSGENSCLPIALENASKFSQYQPVPVQTTKTYTNSGIIQRLKHAGKIATAAHRAGFSASQSAQNNMRKIINK